MIRYKDKICNTLHSFNSIFKCLSLFNQGLHLYLHIFEYLYNSRHPMHVIIVTLTFKIKIM